MFMKSQERRPCLEVTRNPGEPALAGILDNDGYTYFVVLRIDFSLFEISITDYDGRGLDVIAKAKHPND